MTTGTVTLNADADRGGLEVTLSSSDPANAAPQSSVFVPENRTSATFRIVTRVQPVDLRITITGTGGGQTRTGLLRLTPGGPTEPSPYRFSGVVRDGQGNPIQGVAVRSQDSFLPGSSLVTDAAGG